MTSISPTLNFTFLSIVNPLYNNIRYNSKIRYNVRPICTKSADRVFFIDSPMLFFGKTYVLDIY